MKYTVLAILIGTTLSCGSAFVRADDALAQQIQKAQSIIKARQEKIQEAKNELKSLSNDLEERRKKLDEPARDKKSLVPVFFNVQPAMLDWPLDSTYRRHADYAITLDWINKDHQSKLDALYQDWLKDGWFIEKSEVKKLDNAPVNQSTVFVRLVKVH